MASVAIEINGFSLFIRTLRPYLKPAIFAARLDNRFEKREAAPGLSQRRAFITADQMIWFYNLNGVFLLKRVLAWRVSIFAGLFWPY